MSVIQVRGGRPYDVVVERGALGRLPELVAGAARVGVIASCVLDEQADRVAELAGSAGAQVVRVPVPVGEAAKTPDVLARCWRALAAAGFTRSDLVVGVGGGATTDLAGFVAATLLRGVGWIAVPTSVLGMVDAAVGGKTAVDIPEGKNLVGAFWEPMAVLADLDVLAGLAPDEVRSGLGEVAKEGFTSDPRILELIEEDPGDALDVRSDRLAELVRRCVQVKADVVAADLREQDALGRQVLNYGHTLAHAIETHEHFTWRHGAAVAVGTVFAAEVAARALGLSDDVVARHRSVLACLGLPTTYTGASFEQARALMARDKKARGASLRMVLLRDLADPMVLADPPEDALREAYQAIAG